MKADNMMAMVAGGQGKALENAWVRAVENDMPIEELDRVLQALIKAGNAELADTFAWEMLSDRQERLEGQALLKTARVAALAAPDNEDVRKQAADVYRKIHGSHPHFDAMLEASGLLGGQSTRRAVRTLDTCLTAGEGSYLANRFDHVVLRVERFDSAMGEFEVTDSLGRTEAIEPKKLADEFDLVDDDDFRVLHSLRRDVLEKMLEDDLPGVLIAACKANGGEIDANALKKLLVPDHIDKTKWSSWWSRARTAAKRCEQVSLSSDRPVVLSYHPDGRTLEDELGPAVGKAHTPYELLSLARQYVREAQARQEQIDPAFAQKLSDRLADQALRFLRGHPDEALAAALGLKEFAELGLPAPSSEAPTAEGLLSQMRNPAEVIAQVTDPALWPNAVEALARREDASKQFAELFRLAPAEQLDALALRLEADALADAVNEAMLDPRNHAEVILWLWKEPANPPACTPPGIELLSKLFAILTELEREFEGDRGEQKQVRQRVRNALSAANCARFRGIIEQTDEGVVSTVLNTLRRSHGISKVQRLELIAIIREHHYGLFLEKKVAPWDNENVLWTTREALDRREKELKELVEIKMLENAKAIAAAAEHGDLSENSEWKFAMEERDLLRAQAAKRQEELAKARVIEPAHVPTNTVGIGSRVTLRRVDTDETITASLLGPWDSDLSQSIYNYKTPMALAMMGKTIGDEVVLKLSGEDATYRIEALGSAFE